MLIAVVGYQRLGLSDVMALARCEGEPKGIAQSIDTHMDFRTEPSTAPTQSLGGLTTVFLEAPPAHG